MSEVRKFAEVKDQSGQTLIEFFGPGRSNDGLSVGLRMLTHQLLQVVPKSHRGIGFGGAYGYGVEFENEIFSMCPDAQDCTCAWDRRPPHKGKCKKQIDAWFRARKKIEEESKQKQKTDGSATEILGFWSFDLKAVTKWEKKNRYPKCICSARHWKHPEEHEPTCWLVRPRFLHKPSGFQVDWYKYIGRETKPNRQINGNDWCSMLEEILKSIKRPKLKTAIKAYQKAESAEQKACRETAKLAAAFWNIRAPG